MGNTVDTSHSMIDALSSGDEAEFDEGFRRFCINYHLVIRKWCQRWFDHAHEADDAAQELLVKLRRKLKKYQPDPEFRFRNWLSRVSKRLAVDVIRKQSREKTLRFDPEKESPRQLEYIAELFLDFERRDFLRRALKQASTQIAIKDRQILEMYLQESPTGEIAECLSISPNAVHQAMYRVRQSIKGELEQYLVKSGLEIADLFPS